MRRIVVHSMLLACCAWLGACRDTGEPGETAASPPFDSAVAAITPADDSVTDTVATSADTAGRAAATLRDARGRELGTLTLEETPQGVRVMGRLSGLPEGEHAIHLHAVGRCEPPFESAGPHWNPANRQHGLRNPQGPHAGDLPNLEVIPDGLTEVDATTPGGRFRGSGGLRDADGAAVVVHADADDYRTDPAGNAGDRIACGVVQ